MIGAAGGGMIGGPPGMIGGYLAGAGWEGYRGWRRGEPMSRKLSYMLAMPLLFMMYNAIMQYLFTGEGPKENKDLFAFRTGNVDEQGRPERMWPASYVTGIYSFGRHPFRAMQNWLNPLPNLLAEWWRNADYYNVQWHNQDDPWYKRAAQDATTAVKSFKPFSWRGAEKQTARRGSLATKALPFVGTTPTPAEVNRTEAENALADHLTEQSKGKAITQEQAARRDAVRELVRDIKQGQPIQEKGREMQQQGTIGLRDLQRARRAALTNRLVSGVKMLQSVSDVADVYDKGSDQEKATLKVEVQKKINAAAQKPGELTASLKERLRAEGFRVPYSSLAERRQAMGTAAAAP